MRKLIGILTILPLFMAALSWAGPAAGEPAFRLAVREKRIDLSARQASAKAILGELAVKAGITVSIPGQVADQTVTLDEQGLPLASLSGLLARMGFKNHAVTFEQNAEARLHPAFLRAAGAEAGASVAEVIEVAGQLALQEFSGIRAANRENAFMRQGAEKSRIGHGSSQGK